MPRERATAASLGRAARCFSSLAMAPASGVAAPRLTVAHPAANTATPTTTIDRANRMWLILPSSVRIQHVFETHPLRVEIQIDVPGAAVTIFPYQQLGGAFDLPTPVVHVLTEQRQHDVRMVFDRAEDTKVVELGSVV